MSAQGETYAAFIAAELAREHDRREKIDTRAAAAVGGASGLVTIAVAGLAVVRGKDATIGGGAATFAALTIAAFLISAVLAVLAGLPRRYDAVGATTMSAMLDGHWKDSEVTARNNTAYLHVRAVTSLREINRAKSVLLVASLAAQALAVACLGGVVLAVV